MSESATEDLAQRHEAAESEITPFAYERPEDLRGARGSIQLASTDLFRSRVVVLKPDGDQGQSALLRAGRQVDRRVRADAGHQYAALCALLVRE